MRKLINPFNDAAFKLLFGTDRNKEITIGFLNIVLKPESKILDVKFINTELIKTSDDDKTCRVDILCETEDGTKLLVEMQQRNQTNFTNRLLYYGSRLIDRQGGKEGWDYPLSKVHVICLMNFIYDKEKPIFRNDVFLTSSQTGKIFNDKITYTLFQLPCLNNQKYSDLDNDDEKLLYLLKQMEDGNMDHDTLFKMVDESKEGKELWEYYKKFLDVADYESLSKEEKIQYEIAWDRYNSMRCTYAYHIEQGLEQGLAQGMEQGLAQGLEQGLAQGLEQGLEQGFNNGIHHIAKTMKEDSVPIDTIMKYTGLSREEIENI